MVKIDKFALNYKPIYLGVFKGSVLGPRFFIVFIINKFILRISGILAYLLIS